ncbi:MAG TPA: hypothetical protein VI756_25635, partial [Blastocatellia bacterium]
ILAQQPSNSAIESQIQDTQADVQFLASTLTEAFKQKGVGLAQDVAQNQISPLASVLSDLQSLIPLIGSSHPELTTGQNEIASLQTEILADLGEVDVAAAQKRAEKQMGRIKPIVNALVNEINLYSVSPVAAFDMGRIWPDRFGTRYGIGGGIRLSVVNFNVTLGYSVNPNPHPGEGSGAFFFSMKVQDLFR